jgi:hypothetical protein
MKWLLARLKEKSTWLAIFTLAGLLGMKIEPELREHIINAILAVAAVVAFVFREDVKRADLPPIELQGRSEADAPTVYSADGTFIVTRPSSSFARYRDPDDAAELSESKPAGVQPDGKNESGWNG